MNCPNCNAPVEPFDRFCENCGSVLSAKSATEPAQPLAPQDTAQGPVSEGTREPFVDPMAEDAAMDIESEQPASPYETAERVGKHAGAASTQTYVPTAQAVAAAFAESAAAAYAHEDAASKGDPYAAAVNATQTATPYAQVPQGTPVQGETPYAQPVYAQPQSYAQPVYPPAQPAVPYGDYRMENPTGAPKASAAGFVLAIISLVLGCIGLLSFGIFGFLGFVGIILGIIALALRNGYAKRGEWDPHSGSSMGLGIAGIVTNIIAMVIFVALVGLMAISADATSNEYAYDDIASIEQILEDA